LKPGEPLTLGIRPEHLTVADPTAPAGAAPVADLKVTIELAEQLGSETYLYARSADGAPVTIRQSGQIGLNRGASIELCLARDALHIFDAVGLRVAPDQR